ncbi:type II toxin-antitoxin system RelE/ParE family toxin [Rhizobium sp. LjRoot254]|uniref:type II toxin-antitoxin system RelE/ParE family toxin n=1 Tax=Rhizobium sp. LjRoot254 TaxID=3342297 RepID=UPI003ECCB914
MRLRYTPEALVELDGVLADIAEHSPQGARRVQARIKAIIDLLLRHPNAGQLTSLKPMRRIVATPYPYLIFYEPHAEEIIVIGVRHSARDPRSMPDQ